MHKNITHNKCFETYGEFAEATLVFLRDEVPQEVGRNMRSGLPALRLLGSPR